MTVEEALRIFDIYGQAINREIVKKTYRRLCSKYHPDRNPHGLKTMQEVNAAWTYLSDVPDHQLEAFSRNHRQERQERTERPKEKTYHYTYTPSWKWEWERLSAECLDLDMSSYMDGGRMWVIGNTYEHREWLKSERFRWNPEKRGWWKDL